MKKMSEFARVMLRGKDPSKTSVLDVGSLNVNGTYRSLFKGCDYVGLDIVEGDGVDITVVDPWSWKELDGRKFDLIISGQCLEHVEYPWRTAKLMLDHCVADGFLAVTAPARQVRHNYPSDYFRYFEQGLIALFEGEIDVVTAGWTEGKKVDDAWLLARPKWRST